MGGLLFLKNPDFKTTDHLEFARDLLKEMHIPMRSNPDQPVEGSAYGRSSHFPCFVDLDILWLLLRSFLDMCSAGGAHSPSSM
jgi:hypothetical protein